MKNIWLIILSIIVFCNILIITEVRKTVAINLEINISQTECIEILNTTIKGMIK